MKKKSNMAFVGKDKSEAIKDICLCGFLQGDLQLKNEKHCSH